MNGESDDEIIARALADYAKATGNTSGHSAVIYRRAGGYRYVFVHNVKGTTLAAHRFSKAGNMKRETVIPDQGLPIEWWR